jgi:hypothetical protein
MSNWTLLKEFLDNASAPQQGDAVIRINMMVRHDGAKKYSIESGTVGGDFPIRLSRYIPPASMNASIRLLNEARDHLEICMSKDLDEEIAREKVVLQARREKEERDKAKRAKREHNLLQRKVENQARAHGGTGKKKG